MWEWTFVHFTILAEQQKKITVSTCLFTSPSPYIYLLAHLLSQATHRGIKQKGGGGGGAGQGGTAEKKQIHLIIFYSQLLLHTICWSDHGHHSQIFVCLLFFLFLFLFGGCVGVRRRISQWKKIKESFYLGQPSAQAVLQATAAHLAAMRQCL